MKYLLLTLLVLITIGCSNSISSNKLNNLAFDDRSTAVYLINYSYSTLKLYDSHLDGGEWKIKPPDNIPFNTTVHMATQSNAWLTGAGGWVKYKADDGTILKFKWYNPYVGNNSYSEETSNKVYALNRKGSGSGNNASIEWYILNTDKNKNYSAIIMADPQPWRLNTGDPNSETNRQPWLNVNKKVSESILSHKANFHIVNGDLTEYGRAKTYNDYNDIYKKNNTLTLEGLGNHDYANNVGDCTVPEELEFSSDACAISAVLRMYKEINNYGGSVSNYSKDIKAYSGINSVEYIGSLAYSWDYGDVHYVQLHNYPTYQVKLFSQLKRGLLKKVVINKSLDWLENDLVDADSRGKITILNFHDARPSLNDGDSHFIDGSSKEDLDKFKKIIMSHNVKAIFVGHTHQQSFCHTESDAVFGNVPVYTAGALFNGDYYYINVKGKEINVSAYNGITGTPILVKDLGLIGQDGAKDPNCSFK
ncbi:MAG TPA: metallophosphoesterase [Arsenophonus nasoniae]|uniref:metallophosphoesterase n=1 Tax=Arsenophonus nasoniae TaxID=638 RepID=UPI00387963FE